MSQTNRDPKSICASNPRSLPGDEKLASAEHVLRDLLEGSNAMPPLGRLSDDQGADVINYKRTHFGNDYRDAVTVAAVK
jgi:hypothetical protein